MATETRTRTTAPVIDYSKLDAVDTSRQEVAKDNEALVPFRGWLKDSKASGKAKRIVVPAAAAKQAEYFVRKAAALEGFGVSVGSKPQPNGSVAVVFAAKDKKAYDPSKPRKPHTPKRRKTESPADFRARQA